MGGECLVCGCTDTKACITDEGPCYWIDDFHTICSNCADSLES